MTKRVLFKCPRCGHKYNSVYTALSRRDNRTELCPPCGTREALEAAGLCDKYDGSIYWREMYEEV